MTTRSLPTRPVSPMLLLLLSLILWQWPLQATAGVLPLTQTSQGVRAFHMVLMNVPPADARTVVDKVAKNGFNVLLIDWRDGVAFKSYPGELSPGGWQVQQLQDFVAYARAAGLEVVPEVKLLSHQDKFFGNRYPGLLYNKETYDPSKPAVYEKVFPYLDEIITTLKPSALSIAHDEVVGWKPKQIEKKLGKGAAVLPAELFLKDVQILHDFLAKKGVQTWMWGDMLISPDEFPKGADKNMHGNMPGYGKALRQKIPKDIVICDWHYGNVSPNDEFGDREGFDVFPSIGAFRRDGFIVLGASWKNPAAIKAFAQQAAEQGAAGMIATSWFHVRRQEWDVVELIVNASAAAFHQHFPDKQGKPAKGNAQ